MRKQSNRGIVGSDVSGKVRAPRRQRRQANFELGRALSFTCYEKNRAPVVQDLYGEVFDELATQGLRVE